MWIRSEVFVTLGQTTMDHCYTCTASLLDAVVYPLNVYLALDMSTPCLIFLHKDFFQHQQMLKQCGRTW